MQQFHWMRCVEFVLKDFPTKKKFCWRSQKSFTSNFAVIWIWKSLFLFFICLGRGVDTCLLNFLSQLKMPQKLTVNHSVLPTKPNFSRFHLASDESCCNFQTRWRKISIFVLTHIFCYLFFVACFCCCCAEVLWPPSRFHRWRLQCFTAKIHGEIYIKELNLYAY